jgi:hypothetical protein
LVGECEKVMAEVELQSAGCAATEARANADVVLNFGMDNALHTGAPTPTSCALSLFFPRAFLAVLIAPEDSVSIWLRTRKVASLAICQTS